MANITEGSFSLNLGFVQLGGKLSDDDRQCAWELYSEIATRVAVVGKRADPSCTDFNGEIYAESLDSLYNFLRECRGIMRRFPVGRLKKPLQQHLGIHINRIIAHILRPFLEKWHASYRAWWAKASRGDGSPLEIQTTFPRKDELLKDWSDLRKIMRRVEKQLREEYKLAPLE